jgi:hypothetical protein
MLPQSRHAPYAATAAAAACRFSHPRIQVVRNWGEVEAALLTVAAVEAV